MSDIIWATVAAYTVGAVVWLLYTLGTRKSLAEVEVKLDETRGSYGGRLDVLEKAMVAHQREFVNVRDAVTRIENRLSPEGGGPRLAKRWPGEG